MSSKIEVPITSEHEDIEKQMAVVQQPTGTCDEADINNSSSTKSHLEDILPDLFH
jgi:hypothetical protein